MTPQVSIAEACSLVTDGTHYTPADIGSGYPFLTVKDVSDAGLDFDGCARISEKDFLAADAGNSAPKFGDVLFSKDGTVGKVHVVKTSERFAVLSSLAILRPGRDVIPDYLGHVLRFPKVLEEAMKRKTGSAIRRIVLSDLKQVRIPLPSTDEQRRIAAILDKADALRTQRREALAQLDRLAQAIFVEMFGDPVTNPKEIEKRSLASIAEIATGSTPSRSNGEFYEGNIPWIKTTEVVGGEIFDTEEKLTAEGLKAIRGKKHPEGSIVVAMYGQGQTRGRCGLLRVSASCNQACGVIKPSEKFDSVFMFQQLKMAYERLRALGRGGNQENLNLQLLGDFEVLVPSSELQAEFVTRSTEIHALKTKHSNALAEHHSLFTALQHRAFRGEL